MKLMWAQPRNLFVLSASAQWYLRKLSAKQLGILWVPAILLLAVLCIPLPFPTGLPLVALALSVLLNQSRRARMIYVRTKRRLKPDSKTYHWFDRIDRLIRVKRRQRAAIR